MMGQIWEGTEGMPYVELCIRISRNTAARRNGPRGERLSIYSRPSGRQCRPLDDRRMRQPPVYLEPVAQPYLYPSIATALLVSL